MPDYCITEDGRVFDLSPMRKGNGAKELVDRIWRPIKVTFALLDEFHDAHPLSEDEVEVYLSQSKPEPKQSTNCFRG